MSQAAQKIQLANEVARKLAEAGAPCALIGATALAFHGYERATEDIDLAIGTTKPFDELSARIAEVLPANLVQRLSLPDSDDILGGVLTIGTLDEDGDIDEVWVQVINFVNPRRPRKSVISAAISKAQESLLEIPVVDIPYLVALKLFAGSRRDLSDAEELLKIHPEAIESSQHLALQLGLESEFIKLDVC